MNNNSAKQIARLINKRNKLPNKLGSYDILNGNYFYVSLNPDTDREEVIACARAKCMSFFCWEVKHVSVNEKFEGRGFGKIMVRLVEDYIKTKNVPTLMATTCTDNQPAIQMFTNSKYRIVKEFVNPKTQNKCLLWQKDL